MFVTPTANSAFFNIVSRFLSMVTEAFLRLSMAMPMLLNLVLVRGVSTAISITPDYVFGRWR